jgi:hypothetical protein
MSIREPSSTSLTVTKSPALETDRDWKTAVKRLDGPVQVDLLANLQAAARTGASWLTIIREFWSLARGPGRLTPAEYFYYGLYRSDLPPAEKRRFVGKSAQKRMHAACNDVRWFAAVHDKLLFQAAMSGAGFPVPELLAIVHKQRKWPGIPTLDPESLADIEAFLAEPGHHPFFVKPIDGMYSLGAQLVRSYDPATQALMLAFGGQVSREQFAQDLRSHPGGYLIQRRLIPDNALSAVIGDRLASVRVFILLEGGQPRVLRAVCKIPAGNNVADNYWRAGNMLGAIDLASGEIKRVVSGTAKDLREIRQHADSGKDLVGITVPLWKEIVPLVSSAATTFPEVRTQSWDVALTQDGPVLLEVNFGGDLNLVQLAWNSGALDDSYRAHLRNCGYKKRLN